MICASRGLEISRERTNITTKYAYVEQHPQQPKHLSKLIPNPVIASKTNKEQQRKPKLLSLGLKKISVIDKK